LEDKRKHVPSEHCLSFKGQSCHLGQLSIVSLHELSQHLTGVFIGHIIIVGQREILSLHEPSKHLIKF
jgi:hypothetical protein